MPEQRPRDQAGGWRHPGWSWAARHDRLIPAAYWVAGLLIAFALGNVPSLVTGDWKSGTTWVSLWLSVGSAVLAVMAFGFAETTRRGRDRMIEMNGTAYVIQEHARFWSDDDAGRFREGIRRQFARVIQVPGPVEAGRGWEWPLDGDTRQWDAKADDLVRAFRVLRIDETRDEAPGPVGVFLWAYWAVAMAFGMRVTAADRGHPESFAALAEGPASNGCRLDFRSPVYFSQNASRVVTPGPRLVAGSWRRRWNTYADKDLAIPDEDWHAISRSLRLTEFDLRTQARDNGYGQGRQGFTGTATLRLDTVVSPEARAQFTALARFAEYSGTGAQTTHAFGATTTALIPARVPAPGGALTPRP